MSQDLGTPTSPMAHYADAITISPRTSDPDSTHGDWWIRSDITGENNDWIGAIRYNSGGSGVVNIPILPESASPDMPYVRVYVNGEWGRLSLAPQSSANRAGLSMFLGQWYGGHVPTSSAIPDSVVSLSDSNTSTSTSSEAGIEFTTSVEWPKIGFRITQDMSGFTTAYLRNLDDGSLIKSKDISSLSATDTFAIEETIQPNTTYEIVIDAGGSSYTGAAYDSPTYPVDSADGELSVTDGRVDGSSAGFAWSIREIGNVGLS